MRFLTDEPCDPIDSILLLLGEDFQTMMSAISRLQGIESFLLFAVNVRGTGLEIY